MSTLISMQDMFATAHHDFEKGLNVHASFKVCDRETGEDLVQETYLKTWNYLKKGGKVLVMKAFLYHVLNNLIVDEYRKRRAVSLDVLMESGYEPASDDHSSLIDFLDGKTACSLVDRLVLKYRIAIKMRFMEHLTLAEMSKRTGETRNAMAVHVHRGLEKLKVMYEGGMAMA